MSSAPVVFAGWAEATDPNSGKTYYANVTTRETRWTPPEEFTYVFDVVVLSAGRVCVAVLVSAQNHSRSGAERARPRTETILGYIS